MLMPLPLAPDPPRSLPIVFRMLCDTVQPSETTAVLPLLIGPMKMPLLPVSWIQLCDTSALPMPCTCTGKPRESCSSFHWHLSLPPVLLATSPLVPLDAVPTL